jgi:septin 7
LKWNNIFFKFIAESSTEPTENKEKLLKTDQSVTGKSNDRKVKKLDGYVGFANLPNQVYRKAVKKGFEFTLMVVGKFFINHYYIIF